MNIFLSDSSVEDVKAYELGVLTGLVYSLSDVLYYATSREITHSNNLNVALVHLFRHLRSALSSYVRKYGDISTDFAVRVNELSSALVDFVGPSYLVEV